MPKKALPRTNWLQSTAVRVTRVQFLFIAAYMVSVIIFDSWNLIAHTAVSQRWTAAGILLCLNAILWYLARMKFKNDNIYIAEILVIILADIAFAGMNVFWERGMASRAVALFAVPIITAATLRSRNALIATAALCTSAYSIAAVRYFNLHYGEGFRVELYGAVIFYSALFFVMSWLLLIVIRPEDHI